MANICICEIRASGPQGEQEGIDADRIRKQGFDRAWKKVAPVSSDLCYGTDNIGVNAI